MAARSKVGMEGKERAWIIRNGEEGHARLHTIPYHYPSTVGVTFPSGEVQEQLICSLYQPAGLAPESLEYIEAHGTGTKVKALSDPYL